MNMQPVGTKINKYQILELIGEGGEASIFRARDTFAQNEVALKIIHEGRAKLNPEINQLFLREGKILAEIEHQGIIRIHESNIAQLDNRELYYHAMELVNAPTLDKYLETNHLDWRAAARILRAIAEVIIVLHGRKATEGKDDPILHRDLKPSNIFLIDIGDEQNQSKVKIFDFGLAKKELERTITAPDAFRGTVKYPAPELLKVGGRASKASDIYALGRVLEEMLGEAQSEDVPRWVTELKNLMCEQIPVCRPSAEEIVEIIDEQMGVGSRFLSPLTKLVSLRNKVTLRKLQMAIRIFSISVIVFILCVLGYLIYEYYKPGPKVIGNFAMKGEDFYGATISDNYAYIANGIKGIKIADISNPKNIKLVGRCATNGLAREVTLVENYAYVSDSLEGIAIIDISDPEEPKLINSFDTDETDVPNEGAITYDITVSGNLAYIADEYKGIKVIDISDPENLEILGSFDTEKYAYSIAISGNYAYVADESNGLNIIDITDPANMSLVAKAPSHRAKDVEIRGNYAFLADGETGLVVIDITDPSKPRSITGANIDSEGESVDIELSGDRACIADGRGGMMIIDISNPEKPRLIKRIRTREPISDVAVQGNYAYLTIVSMGLVVVRLD